MSETIQNQEQPETTLHAEQPQGETPVPEETTTTTTPEDTTTTSEQETTPMTIGGQVIEKKEDGSTETTVFPVTEVPSPAPEAAAEQDTTDVPTTEAEPQATETTEAPAPAETKIDLAETEEIATVAEQPVKPEAPATNGAEVAPAAGLASLPILIAAGVKRFRLGKKH